LNSAAFEVPAALFNVSAGETFANEPFVPAPEHPPAGAVTLVGPVETGLYHWLLQDELLLPTRKNVWSTATPQDTVPQLKVTLPPAVEEVVIGTELMRGVVPFKACPLAALEITSSIRTANQILFLIRMSFLVV
jgi:hypothetical protein